MLGLVAVTTCTLSATEVGTQKYDSGPTTRAKRGEETIALYYRQIL